MTLRSLGLPGFGGRKPKKISARNDWIVGEKGQEWAKPKIAACCGHAVEAHDPIGCLITACKCVLLHGDPDRFISIHELAEMFRLETEEVEEIAVEQVVRFDRDSNGHLALRARHLGAFKVVAGERGY